MWWCVEVDEENVVVEDSEGVAGLGDLPIVDSGVVVECVYE